MTSFASTSRSLVAARSLALSLLVTLKSTHGGTPGNRRFGLRLFEFVPHGPFSLTASALIRGTQRHEDHAGMGAAMTEDLIRREFHADQRDGR